MTNKEKAIRWFENIAEECDQLTSGNVAHLRTQIKGMALRSAEYLKKQEPASEDLEKESDIMATKLFKEFFPQDGDTITSNDFCKGLRSFAYHFTQWQKEQMMKAAVDSTVTSIREYKEENEIDFTVMLDKGIVPYVLEEDVKLIIIKSKI